MLLQATNRPCSRRWHDPLAESRLKVRYLINALIMSGMESRLACHAPGQIDQAP